MINKTYKLRDDDENITLTTYILDDVTETKTKKPAVVIFPGGGYCFCSPREGEPYAVEFLQAGIHAFVLNYTVQKPYPESLKDASRAVAMVREHAEEWDVDPDNIYVCGSSAGGHLAASLGVFWNREEAIKQDYPNNKPNGMILCYPVITSGEWAHVGSIDVLSEGQEAIRPEMSLENQITKDTPKAFLWHTFDDSCVPVQNSLMMADALRKENIPFELHIYPHGNHGESTGKENVGSNNLYISNWIERAAKWVWFNAKNN